MTDASSSLVTKVDQLDTDTNAFLREVGANTAGIDTALTSNESNLAAIDNSYAHIVGNTVQARLAAERTEAFSEAKSLRQAMHLAVAPRPDLWLPLVSNLKMREGFGSVSFSRSTTATYINKSGQLVTAKANEPRFEREGLLVEGGSTNLCHNSANLYGWSAYDGATIGESPDSLLGTKTSGITWPAGKKGSNNNIVQKLVGSLGAGTFTLSMYLKHLQGNPVRPEVYISGGYTDQKRATTSETNGYTRHLLTFTIRDTQATNSVYIRVYNVKGSDNNIVTKARVGCVQLEKLHFATSYIPTTDKAVTRSRDAISTDGSDVIQLPATVAYTLTNYRISQTYGAVLNVGNKGKGVAYLLQTRDSRSNTFHFHIWGNNKGNVGSIVGLESLKVAINVNDSVWTYYLNNNRQLNPNNVIRLGKPKPVFEIGDPASFFHLRNFRVWRTPLTPEQIAFL